MPIRLRGIVAAVCAVSLLWEWTRHAPGAVLFGTVVVFGTVYAACFVLGDVWPTPWRYEQTGASVVRIRRSTGEADVLTSTGWRPLTGVTDSPPVPPGAPAPER